MKYLLLILCAIFCSCSDDDVNKFNNDKPNFPDHFENKLPDELIGEYIAADRTDTEPGTLRITKDSIISKTMN